MFQPARGTRDFLPDEMLKRNWVLDNIRRVFEDYGYEPLGTPAFESWDMLKIKSGEDAVNQIYYFKDKSDRELGLRFEWTASLVRVVSTHRELPKPFKRYAIGPVWRYERPSEKRFREFWQADVDIVGVEDTIADTEVLAVAVDCLMRIGFEGFMIRLNDRRLLEALVAVAGIDAREPMDVFRAIDKIDKIGEEGVLEELGKLGTSEEDSRTLLGLVSRKGEPQEIIQSVKKELSDFLSEGEPEILLNGVAACDDLLSIVNYTKDFGIESNVIADLGLARGLDYYTGAVFEIYALGYEDYGSIAGGGRYDKVVELFGGEPTPMTGVSLGIERIVLLLDKKGSFEGLNLGTDVFVVSVSDNVRSEVVKVVQSLRRAGIPSEFDHLSRGMRRQLEIADRKGVRKVVIVGKRELAGGYVTVRDMATAEQRKVPIDRLVDEI
ncbi:MAG TPA: histidine--tRNA ligase [Patescibacteria group bacterium]|nr:histidine--tRNA ligase [Patescibacteria group bacterium]